MLLSRCPVGPLEAMVTVSGLSIYTELPQGVINAHSLSAGPIPQPELAHLPHSAQPRARRGQRSKWLHQTWWWTSGAHTGVATSPFPSSHTRLFGCVHFSPRSMVGYIWERRRGEVNFPTLLELCSKKLLEQKLFNLFFFPWQILSTKHK